MGLDFTVEVSNVSSEVTLLELITFFSYCGSVEKIQLQRSIKDKSSQWALVTFRQPYASQTALLLNNAVLSGRPIHVLPSNDLPILSVSDEVVNIASGEEEQEIVSGIRFAISKKVLKGLSVLIGSNKSKCATAALDYNSKAKSS